MKSCKTSTCDTCFFPPPSLLPTSLPAPKIVFNRLNGKKYHHPAPALPADNHQEETFTAAHEENVKFVYEGEEMKEWSDWKYKELSL